MSSISIESVSIKMGNGNMNNIKCNRIAGGGRNCYCIDYPIVIQIGCKTLGVVQSPGYRTAGI